MKQEKSKPISYKTMKSCQRLSKFFQDEEEEEENSTVK